MAHWGTSDNWRKKKSNVLPVFKCVHTDSQETTEQLVQHTPQAITDKQPKDVLSKLVKARTQITVIQINVI